MKTVCRHNGAAGSSLGTNLGHGFPQSSRLRVVLAGLLACSLISLTACQQVEVKPVDIAEHDTCTACKSPILEKPYAAEFITKDGFPRKFDDVACMVEHAKKVGRDTVAGFYVMEYTTQQWLEADKAHFVKSELIKTPHNSGILAVKDPSQAQGMASQYQGTALNFEDLMK